MSEPVIVRVYKAEGVVNIFEGKHGFYPAPYETYEKLKRLNYLAILHRTLAKNWDRWNRKHPHNRVIRRKIRNDKGQVIGYEVERARPEPFCPNSAPPSKAVVNRGTDRNGGIRYSREAIFEIEREYANARHPKPVATDVKPMSLTDAEIDKLLAFFEDNRTAYENFRRNGSV